MTDFTEKELSFIKAEFSLSKEDIEQMNDDELTELQSKCFDIEVEETVKSDDNELSERGQMAVRLVDILHGPYDMGTLIEEEPEHTATA